MKKVNRSRRNRKPEPYAKQHAFAAQLAEMLGGEITVEFTPDSSYDADPESAGHLFTAYAGASSGFDSMFVDDRDEETPVVHQLVAELRRVGRRYFALARQLEDASMPSGPLPLFGERRFTVLGCGEGEYTFDDLPGDCMTREEALAEAAATGGIAVEFYAEKGFWGYIEPGKEASLYVSCRCVQGQESEVGHA
jgi:hypothetical protein